MLDETGRRTIGRLSSWSRPVAVRQSLLPVAAGVVGYPEYAGTVFERNMYLRYSSLLYRYGIIWWNPLDDVYNIEHRMPIDVYRHDGKPLLDVKYRGGMANIRSNSAQLDHGVYFVVNNRGFGRIFTTASAAQRIASDALLADYLTEFLRIVVL